MSLSSVKRYARIAREGRPLTSKKNPGKHPKVGESARALLEADLTDADLPEVDMEGADLEGAELSGANLEGARGVTIEDLEEKAASLEGATMPDGTKHN